MPRSLDIYGEAKLDSKNQLFRLVFETGNYLSWSEGLHNFLYTPCLVSRVPMYSEAKLAFIIYLWYPKTMVCVYSFFVP